MFKDPRMLLAASRGSLYLDHTIEKYGPYVWPLMIKQVGTFTADDIANELIAQFKFKKLTALAYVRAIIKYIKLSDSFEFEVKLVNITPSKYRLVAHNDNTFRVWNRSKGILGDITEELLREVQDLVSKTARSSGPVSQNTIEYFLLGRIPKRDIPRAIRILIEKDYIEMLAPAVAATYGVKGVSKEEMTPEQMAEYYKNYLNPDTTLEATEKRLQDINPVEIVADLEVEK